MNSSIRILGRFKIKSDEVSGLSFWIHEFEGEDLDHVNSQWGFRDYFEGILRTTGIAGVRREFKVKEDVDCQVLFSGYLHITSEVGRLGLSQNFTTEESKSMLI